MTPTVQRDHNGLTITIYPDEDPHNPRGWCNLGTMVCFHNHYDLGDNHRHRSPHDFLADLAGVPTLPDDTDPYEASFASLHEYLDQQGFIVMPLFMNDHSGITMSTAPFACPPLDSGQVGYIVASPNTIRRECGDGPDAMDRALRHLEAEVATYDAYLRGDFRGYVITDDSGNVLDSCWGFESFDYALTEATAAAESIAANADRFIAAGI